MKNFKRSKVWAVTKKIRQWLGEDTAVIGLTLGSGLGGFGTGFPGAREISFQELGLPVCQAKGHAGVLRYVPIDDRGVLVLDGRVHAYEGHSFKTVVMAVRALALLGIKIHILTCASGGVNKDFKPGELVLIDDHINLMGGNPLVGVNNDQFGPRFPDLTNLYDAELRQLAVASSQVILDQPLRSGVYAAVLGPCYETPAEVRMQRALGADLNGMSTIPEAIALRHLGVKVLGIACVANHAAGVTNEPLSHADVVAACSATAPRFRDLLLHIIPKLPV